MSAVPLPDQVGHSTGAIQAAPVENQISLYKETSILPSVSSWPHCYRQGTRSTRSVHKSLHAPPRCPDLLIPQCKRYIQSSSDFIQFQSRPKTANSGASCIATGLLKMRISHIRTCSESRLAENILRGGVRLVVWPDKKSVWPRKKSL